MPRQWGITDGRRGIIVRENDIIDPISPGELLKEAFLEPLGISQYRLAKEIGVPAQRIGQILLNRRAVTADTDLRLCRFFGLSDGYWFRAQAAYDIEVARRKLSPDLRKIRPWKAAACAELDQQDGSDRKKSALEALVGTGEGSCSNLTDEEMRAKYRNRYE